MGRKGGGEGGSAMASEGLFSISVASVVEDVLKQHGTRPSDMDLASRKAKEAGVEVKDFLLSLHHNRDLDGIFIL